MMKPLVVLVVVGWVGSHAFAQGFLGQQMVNPASLYSGVGGPVAGASYSPYAAAGSGQMMMQACPYPIAETVDPYAKDELVQAAKKDARASSKKIDEAIKNKEKAQREFDRAADRLGDTLEGWGTKGGKAFIEFAVDCKNHDPIAGGAKPVTGPPIGDGKPSPEYVAWAAPTHKLYKDDKRYAPCFYAWDAHKTGSSGFEEAQMCGMGFEVGADADERDMQGDKTHHYAGNIRAGDQHRQDACVDYLRQGIKAKEDLDIADQAIKDAKREYEEKLKDYKYAKEDSDDRRKERDEIGDDDDDAKSTGKRCAYCEAELKLKKQSLWIGAGATLGIGTLSFLLGRQEINTCSRMGFVCSGYGIQNGIQSFASGLRAGAPFLQYGMSPVVPPGAYGYPMMYQNMYGATPGGFSQGGFGCAPTMAMSPFSQAMGPFNSAMPGYFPGAAYMPGMGPWGIPGAGQVIPGMPGVFPGGYNQGGGFNPAMYQYMAQMNQAYQDQMRLNAAQMSAIGYGINSLNQEYQWANSLGGGWGSSGWGGGGSFGGFNGFNTGFSPLMSGSFVGGYARNACGGSPFGNSISICGAFPTGGGFSPTYTNGFSPYGNSFNLSGGATFGR